MGRTDDQTIDAAQTPVVRATPAPARQKWRWVLAGASLLATVLLAEAVVRVFGLGPPVYAPRRFEPDGRVPFMALAGRARVYQPNATFSSVYDPAGDQRGYLGPGGRVTYHINRLGLRGPDFDFRKPPGTLRVLCLGDSFTFGEGVRYADTYPAQLRDLLSAAGGHRSVEVINAGVQAHNTEQSVAFFQSGGRRFEPDVVILGFVLNDATEFDETIRRNEARTEDVALSPLARVSRLWEILERGRRARKIQEEFFETTRRSFRSERWSACKDLLKSMQAFSRQDAFRFIVVLFPIFTELDGDYPFEDLHALVREACRTAGCGFIDLLEVYRGHRPESFWVHPTDPHPNERAHRLAAERIADYLTHQRR